jgi:CRISPR-associated protein Cas2
MLTQLVVMVYDIADDKRRNRVHKLLKQYAVPIQESAFEARLEKPERKHLLDLVSRIIDTDKDTFVMYPIVKDAEEKVVTIGIPRPDVPVQTFFIV